MLEMMPKTFMSMIGKIHEAVNNNNTNEATQNTAQCVECEPSGTAFPDNDLGDHPAVNSGSAVDLTVASPSADASSAPLVCPLPLTKKGFPKQATEQLRQIAKKGGNLKPQAPRPSRPS